MNREYREHKAERDRLGIPPLPLTTEAAGQIGKWLAEGRDAPPDGAENLVALLADRVPAGVDPAAEVKGSLLADAIAGKIKAPGLSAELAVELLGAMQGGYNMPVLLSLLSDSALAPAAVKALSGCILAGSAVDEAARLCKAGNPRAKALLESWAAAEWFTNAPALPKSLRLVVYKVDGEVNTDDLSPAKQAPTRPDIPLHALSLGETRFPGGRLELEKLRREAEATGFHPVFVADTLGTGSSRKSAINSLVWVLGNDIPRIPNKRQGGVVIASRSEGRDTLNSWARARSEGSRSPGLRTPSKINCSIWLTMASATFGGLIVSNCMTLPTQ